MITISDNLTISSRQAAIVAGSGLLAMAAAAAFSFGFAHASLFVQGDAAATFQNIIDQSALFKAEIIGWLIILLCDIAVAWACYIYFQPVHKHLSLLAALFRLMYTAILGMVILQLVSALQLSNIQQTLPGSDAASYATQAMLYFHNFDAIWSLGLIIFGLHLLLLGILALRSNRVPRILGILLLIASAGYLVVHTGDLLFSGSVVMDMIENILIVPMTIGELGFGLWLLLRGGSHRA